MKIKPSKMNQLAEELFAFARKNLFKVHNSYLTLKGIIKIINSIADNEEKRGEYFVTLCFEYIFMINNIF